MKLNLVLIAAGVFALASCANSNNGSGSKAPSSSTQSENSTKLVLSNDIEKAERDIDNSFNAFMSAKDNQTKNALFFGLNKAAAIAELNLHGNIAYEGHDNGENSAFVKVTAEPMSQAYGFLESIVLQGHPKENYSGKSFFTSPNSNRLGILTFEDRNEVIIEYWSDYHMVIGNDDAGPYVLSFNFSEKEQYLNYETPYFGFVYNNVEDNFEEDYEAIMNFASSTLDVSSAPFSMVKEIYLDDGRDLHPTYSSENPDHVLYSKVKNKYFSDNVLSEIYFKKKYYVGALNSQDTLEISDNTLRSVDYLSMTFELDVPEGVTTIEKLYGNSDRTNYIYCLHLPSSVETILPSAINENVITDCVFIDGETPKPQLESVLKGFNPDIKIYYSPDFQIVGGLYVPNAFHNQSTEDDHEHVFTKKIASENIFCEEANCQHPTRYFYSCNECDATSIAVFEEGELGSHIFSEIEMQNRFPCIGYFVYERCEICNEQTSTWVDPVDEGHEYNEDGHCRYCGKLNN